MRGRRGHPSPGRITLPMHQQRGSWGHRGMRQRIWLPRQRSRLTVSPFNPLTEIHRSGVTVVNDPDVEWFTWSPRTETIALQPAFGPTFKRGTVTLALAHRALGHWGMS